eukprot:6718412-Lingulodinium_polyedra.AAC.1
MPFTSGPTRWTGPCWRWRPSATESPCECTSCQRAWQGSRRGESSTQWSTQGDRAPSMSCRSMARAR